MNLTFADALSYLDRPDAGDDLLMYSEAILEVWQNRERLPYPVYVDLPATMMDPATARDLNFVILTTGSDRHLKLQPFNRRRNFSDSGRERLNLVFGGSVFLRAIGAPENHAYTRLSVICSADGQLALEVIHDPCVIRMGEPFWQADETLPFELLMQFMYDYSPTEGRQVLSYPILGTDQKIPLCAVLEVNALTSKLVLALDAGVEKYTPGTVSAESN